MVIFNSYVKLPEGNQPKLRFSMRRDGIESAVASPYRTHLGSVIQPILSLDDVNIA
jgi:hypothetical protein